MTARNALQGVVRAWEALPEGHHSVNVVARWIREDMKRAIDAARIALTRESECISVQHDLAQRSGYAFCPWCGDSIGHAEKSAQVAEIRT